MTVRRASFFALVAIVVTAWLVAIGCNLESGGYGETEDVCTEAIHCDDGNRCTEDTCGQGGVCVHAKVGDGQFPDGITGNCKVLTCTDGVEGELAFAADVDDGDECTVDACNGSSGPSHVVQSGATCHFQGGLGKCQGDGSCSIECGYLDTNGKEVECPLATGACEVAFCDKAAGVCVLEKLDGIVVPGTAAGDCGGSYCVAGVKQDELSDVGTACAQPSGTPGMCDASGSCVLCLVKSDCDDNIPESLCHGFECVGGSCVYTSEPDGPLDTQDPGDCHTKRCTDQLFQDQIDNTDVKVDNKDCTDDICVNGVPSNPNSPLNAGCGAGGALHCDGSGKCKGCVQDDQCVGLTDCKTPVCDVGLGECGFTYQPVGKPTSMQIPGDCTDIVCDGNGNTMNQVQLNDPNDDELDCTTDTCVAMNNTTHLPVAVGLTCNDAGGVVCDAAAHCVGKPCAINSECPLNTFCIDGVCCDSLCGGPCTACSAAKKGTGPNGLCGVVVSGDPDGMDCPGNSGCNMGVCQPLALGQACASVAGECQSGNCIDGVCCGAACGATCFACNLAGNMGNCTLIPNTQDPSNECANGACDGTGACRKNNGQPCAMGSECLNNICIDGVCCGTACTGTCQACSAAKTGGANGTCGNVTIATDPDNECAAGACNGGGQCKLDDGQTCFGNGDCLNAHCVDGVCCNTACTGTCQACTAAKTGGTTGTCGNVTIATDPDNECVGTTNCNGGTACAKLPTGTACTIDGAAGECSSTFCVDGFCCGAACTGPCRACSAAKTGGANGTCANVPTNTDPDNECTNTQVCNGAAACKKVIGDTCAASADCLLGNCVDNRCCDNTCSGTCQACNLAANPGTCTSVASGQDPANECPGATSCNGSGTCALFVNGTACNANNECSSNFCVDNVCCNVACGGLCLGCTAALTGITTGTCSPITGGNDPANECAGTTSCNGSGACALYALGATCAANNECMSGFCVDGACCSTGTCAGSCKSCDPGETVSGTAGLCDFIAPNTDPDNECSGAVECNGAGACEAAMGVACTMNSQCQSNFCVDNFCCNAACSGTCQACSMALTGQPNGMCTDFAMNTDPANECTGAQVCGMMGTCVKALDGGACPVDGTDPNCMSTHCVDGVCCGSATCTGPCKSCNQTETVGGALGVCDFSKAGTDPDMECGAMTCNGSGACN